jgi:SAM-dependent MidA family methyltransferase
VTGLAALIRDRIAAEGPLQLDASMALCLGHPTLGYYTTRDPLGAAGDFTTAPEISQMFGELLGAWAAQVWADLGRPARFVLAELGPGRGTLMRDALRAGGALPGFREAAEIWLVETSPALRARQAEALGALPNWTDAVGALPAGPLIVFANEFFDALPIRQAQRADVLWRERLVTVAADRLAFTWGPPRADAGLEARFPRVPDGAIVEMSPAGEAIAAHLGTRLARDGGAALVIDYGAWDGTGDTLQALYAHASADPLADPGKADLTAHVRFRSLAAAARPAVPHGPVTQGLFLETLGITARAQALARGRSGADLEAIVAAHRRLTHPEEMGNLFRVLALTGSAAPQPPGFGT